jgi:hypothetical protein
MKEVIVKQCDYCDKTSKSKSQMKKHEEKCFNNPRTQSCATCLWYGNNHFKNAYTCFRGKGYVNNSSDTVEFKLQTICPEWESMDLIQEIDILSPLHHDILCMLLSGERGIIQAVENWNNIPFD